MNFLKFLFSKYFFKQLTKAVFFSILILFSLYIYLKISTNHNQYIKVPNLDGINFEQAIKILEESDLSYVVLDSALYNPKYPKFSVVDQLPKSNTEVKRNRKIYLTLNPSNYGKVSIPNIIQITQRSASSALLASNLEIGEILYENNIGKDMVLQILFNGNEINPGEMVPKKSKIDLVLGNGIIDEKFEDGSK
jgi:beta-lactam-binding protein with PASTA domain|tara:strand:- start:246 stop:824 length:579 start_codon:yes stop_codon:yes gene_type:complete